MEEEVFYLRPSDLVAPEILPRRDGFETGKMIIEK
jgi:hypothetical protein